MTAAHTTRVKSFSAAGDRRWFAWCQTCTRVVGKQTTDRTRAETEAAEHELAGVRGAEL